MLHALNTYNQKIISKRRLAYDAINIEQNIIKEHVGSQDQTNAAFGGFNHIEFKPNNKIEVNPIILSQKKQYILRSHLMLFFTGFPRTASDISKHQIEAIKNNMIDLSENLNMVSVAKKLLEKNNFIKKFGNLLHEQWLIKKSYTNKISNSAIDKIYNTGIKSGAYGGKLLGAGGGGFIVFIADPKHHNKIKRNLIKLLHVPVDMESLGSQIVYYSNAD